MSGHHSKLEVKEMGGKTFDHHGECIDDPSLKGFFRYFNSSTVRGRANVSKATVCGIVGYIVYRKVSKAFSGDAEKAKNPVISAETA
jgi:hypothetical protein